MAKKNKNQKPHIGIFGRRNVGKSSLINFLTGQDIAIVSEIAGTTTDPVKKTVEILGVGPVVLIDTAGIDDVGEIGKLRIERSKKTTTQIDMAILVIANNIFGEYENQVIAEFKKNEVPFFILHNKADLFPLNKELNKYISESIKAKVLDFSLKESHSTEALSTLIKEEMPKSIFAKKTLLKGIVHPKDIVLLVTPIDSEAPEGRMILPQVMVWRDLLDNDCICISVKDSELVDFLELGVTPKLVITDSQAFEFVSELIPKTVALTSFSIVLARQKGNFRKYLDGAERIAELQHRDKVLILESCTHQVSCEDIGRVKIPKWVNNFSEKQLEFEVVSGFSEIKHPPEEYALVIQCGGCVVTEKQLQNRLKPFIDSGISVTNYGMAIAFVNGIFHRAVAPFL